MLWLGAGLGLGLLIESAGILDLPTWVLGLRIATTHMLVVGWLTQLIFGVAYWMFPRRGKPEAQAAGWVGYVGLNLGLATRLLGEGLTPATLSTTLMLVNSSALQLVGGCAMIALIWPRVKER